VEGRTAALRTSLPFRHAERVCTASTTQTERRHPCSVIGGLKRHELSFPASITEHVGSGRYLQCLKRRR
jgi:hypothetical protein